MHESVLPLDRAEEDRLPLVALDSTYSADLTANRVESGPCLDWRGPPGSRALEHVPGTTETRGRMSDLS